MNLRWRSALAVGWLLLAFGCKDPDRQLPTRYRGLPIPKARLASSQARASGRRLYLVHCAICHGENADGQRPRHILSVRPADFTNRSWRAEATPRRTFFVIREGVHGTPMPAWPSFSDEETWDLVAYVLSVSG